VRNPNWAWECDLKRVLYGQHRGALILFVLTGYCCQPILAFARLRHTRLGNKAATFSDKNITFWLIHMELGWPK
jgi:hypothetical protein